MIFALIVLLISSSYAQDCSNKVTCGACIQQFGCYWCSTQDTTGNQHCFNTSTERSRCNAAQVVAPKTTLKATRNEDIQLKPGLPLVQMKPQNVKITLRRGEEYELKFQYGQAPNFPIDLYYLMDLSASMKDYKNNLALLGKDLIETMRNITSNFKIGFGSFVDKTDMPFISTVPAKIKNPCSEGNPCAPAYSFKNHQTLSDDEQFSQKVNDAKVSGNLDSPEGGFDALMQAMVCKNEIGWRDNARHLIVFSTDAAFHIAGDGKLAGVVEPNDAKCHMKENEYTDALIYDYPSISHINYIAKNLGFNIFFAIVKAPIVELYRSLGKEIENSEVTELKLDSKIATLIKDFYNKISASVKMVDTSDSNVEVTYSCKYKNGTACGLIPVNEVVDYTAKIKMLDCAKNQKQQFVIRPGTLNVTLVVNLELICDCECEKQPAEDSEACKGSGGIKCGICSCKEGFYGKTCECNGQNDFTVTDNSQCMEKNDSRICSGVGSCICGSCQCNPRDDPRQRVYGKYCECDNYSCPKSNGKLCGDNGNCDCGSCKCSQGWSGESCSCKDNEEICTREGQVCTGKGSCQCSECKCETGYYGDFCEECINCLGGRCEALIPCVQCRVHNTGKYKDDCDVQCSQYPISVVEEINDIDSENIKVCRSFVDDNCQLIFKYFYDNKDIIIEARKELQCAAPIIYALVFGLIGSILLIGILTLIIWKMVILLHDRREYAKFQNERENSKWNRNDNPLFKAPVTKFVNPAYARK